MKPSPTLAEWLHLQKNNKPKVRQIWNVAISLCLIANVRHFLWRFVCLWSPGGCIFILQSQPNCSLRRHTWASFKLTDGDTGRNVIAAVWSSVWADQPGMFSATWVQPAAHTKLCTNTSAPLAVPSLSAGLEYLCKLQSQLWSMGVSVQ